MGRGKEKNEAPSKVHSWKITGWESLTSVFQAVIAGFLCFATIWLMCRSNELAEMTSQEASRMAEEIRRLEVQPILRLGATRVINRSRNLDAVVVRVSNAGNGSALDLNVILKESGHGYCRQLIHSFYPVGVFPRFDYSPMNLFWTPVEPELDSILIRDFIHPGEELEFQYGGPLGQRSQATTFTLRLSYFDSDGNEYYTSTSLVPGANTMQVALNGADKFFDSLDQIDKPEVLYEYKTLVNPGMRERGRFWGTEAHWYSDSVDGGR